MENEKCDLTPKSAVKQKNVDVINDYTINYHANGKTMWSKGKLMDDQPDGYWE
ncbi:hypothetical protein AB4Z29_01120 [Paenibacillus sp. 2TAB23]|uniref:hypothetical protein n=1 Tax=Paenibacillus sp. 2TAB23 TaxID=3233004 RepID=UPI003F94C440